MINIPYIYQIIGLLFSIIFLTQHNTSTKIITDFTNKRFLLYIIGISLFSYYILHNSPNIKRGKDLKEAIRKALAALFIAYLAHLELIFAPFFLVFILDYNLSGWF